MRSSAGRRAVRLPRARSERDGILANLYLLDFMVSTGRSRHSCLKKLFDIVGEHHYDRIDTVIEPSQKGRPCKAQIEPAEKGAGLDVVKTNLTDGSSSSSDGSWLLIRFRGRNRW